MESKHAIFVHVLKEAIKEIENDPSAHKLNDCSFWAMWMSFEDLVAGKLDKIESVKH